MSSSNALLARFTRSCSGLYWFALAVVTVSVAGASACSSAEHLTLPDSTTISSIEIDSTSQLIERGTRRALTATVKDRGGKKVDVPVVWRSSNEKVAVFELGGVLVALDTGVTQISAASLSVTSTAVAIRVVWVGPAKIAQVPWTPPTALNPGAALHDSLRVLVTNIAGAPVPNAHVRFSVTAGGGRVSSPTDSTGPNGVASVQWTLGPSTGKNAVVASVLNPDGSLDTLVANNAATFSLTSYRALAIDTGSGQTAQILSQLPVSPSVKLVDSTGAPRRGIPVQFTAFGGGRVAVPLVSTDAGGVASPGAWTLGDTPGDQLLTATVEDATVSFHATGTGTPIHYSPNSVVAGAFATCAINSSGIVDCWGQAPQNGSGDTASIATPTTIKGSLAAASVAGGSTHFCAVTGSGQAWCWGPNAFVDTTGKTVHALKPTELPTDLTWSKVSPGGAHNCGITLTQTAYCWGLNSNGQLGTRDTTRHYVPTEVTGSFKFSQISSGTAHTCALTPDGSAFCWGANQSGQLGDGTTQSRTSPTAVIGTNTFQAIGAGDSFSCGLTTAGRVYCWGAISTSNQPSPITYPDAPTFVSLTVGGAHACALTGDGTAYCWGNNSSGQLGDSTQTSRTTPTKVAGGLQFSQLSAGFVHTCGRTLDGAVACWGFNGSGELGDRNAASRSVPRFIVLGVTPQDK